MDERLKAMIAIGASATANGIPYHFAKAREVGVTDAEMTAVVQVGKMVRKGAVHKWDEDVSALLSAQSEPQHVTCGCDSIISIQRRPKR